MLDRTEIDALKDHITIPFLWERFELNGSPAQLCSSPFRNDYHPSFSVSPDGRLWNDFKPDEGGGDAISFIAKAKNLDCKEAFKLFLKIAEEEGLIEQGRCRPRPDGCKPPAMTAKESKPIYKVTQRAREWFSEGQSNLLQDARYMLKELSEWRGWPIGFVRSITKEGWISYPRLYREDVLAFPVQIPVESPFGFSTEIVGYHVLDPRLRQWYYRSGDCTRRVTPPALPLVLGNFASCQKLLILEGQWDALSLAYALGFFKHETAWDSNYCIVGIRGAANWKNLIKYYGHFWPQKCKCYLIPDDDEAGKSWTEEGSHSFLTELQKLCTKVKAFTFKGSKDFNDWLRANPRKLKPLKKIFL